MSNFFSDLFYDILNGLLNEPGYVEPWWKTILLFIPRIFIGIILLPIMAFIFLLDAISRIF